MTILKLFARAANPSSSSTTRLALLCRTRRDAEDVFAQAVREEEHKEELLEKKFQEAFEKVDKDDTPPPHPFDYK